MKGDSGGAWPMYDSNMKSITNNQNNFWCIDLYNELLTSEVFTNGKTSKTSKEANKAKTPSNLFGIDLSIA